MSCTDSMASEDLPVHCMPWLTNADAASRAFAAVTSVRPVANCT